MKTLPEILDSLVWISGNMEISEVNDFRLALMMRFDHITYVSVTDNSGTTWIAAPQVINEVYGVTPEEFKERSYSDLRDAIRYFRSTDKGVPTQILSVYTYTPGDRTFYYLAFPGYGHYIDVVDMPRFA